MADDADLASEREELARTSGLYAVAENAKARAMPFAGACYNCEAVLEAPLLFCDVDCRDDWQKRNRVL